MSATKRKTLRLPQAEATGSAPEASPVLDAETALEDIASLRARLDAALEEIDALKKRASSQKPSPILSRGKFVASLARRLGPGVTIHGCVARISIGNFDEVRERLGDEAAEELCVSVGSWLGGHVRQTDLVGRVGSGTFAIFFGFADKKNVREKMERLTKRIEHAPVTFKDETLFPKLSIEFEDVDADGEKVAEEASCAVAG